MTWTLHHTQAYCVDCAALLAEAHGPDADHAQVLRVARRHSDRTGHYVQVERGQHAHYRQR